MCSESRRPQHFLLSRQTFGMLNVIPMLVQYTHHPYSVKFNQL
jgi:hypothetical protein